MSGSPTAAAVDAAGIHAPTYDEILAYLRDAARAIFGPDLYIEPDSQDGQLLAIMALAAADANNAVIAAYAAFSPATAIGEGLSRMVQINGIARAVPTFSSADLLLVGQAGTVVTNGIAIDVQQNQWALPASVTIPLAGQITATARCLAAGAVVAAAGSINRIATVTLGWQTVTNPADATPGAPVETDAALRVRQGQSTMIPSLTVLEGIVGGIAALPGVARIAPYENPTAATDANGVPAHSIALVVDGGDAAAIAAVIAAKKTPGAGTYGTTTETVTRPNTTAIDVRFFRPTMVTISVAITIHALADYSSDVGGRLVQSVVDYVAAMAIGEDVFPTRLYVPASLYGGQGSATYKLISVLVARAPGAPGAADVVIAFDEAPTTDAGHVTLTVT